MLSYCWVPAVAWSFFGVVFVCGVFPLVAPLGFGWFCLVGWFCPLPRWLSKKKDYLKFKINKVFGLDFLCSHKRTFNYENEKCDHTSSLVWHGVKYNEGKDNSWGIEGSCGARCREAIFSSPWGLRMWRSERTYMRNRPPNNSWFLPRSTSKLYLSPNRLTVFLSRWINSLWQTMTIYLHLLIPQKCPS